MKHIVSLTRYFPLLVLFATISVLPFSISYTKIFSWMIVIIHHGLGTNVYMHFSL